MPAQFEAHPADLASTAFPVLTFGDPVGGGLVRLPRAFQHRSGGFGSLTAPSFPMRRSNLVSMTSSPPPRILSKAAQAGTRELFRDEQHGRRANGGLPLDRARRDGVDHDNGTGNSTEAAGCYFVSRVRSACLRSDSQGGRRSQVSRWSTSCIGPVFEQLPISMQARSDGGSATERYWLTALYNREL